VGGKGDVPRERHQPVLNFDGVGGGGGERSQGGGVPGWRKKALSRGLVAVGFFQREERAHQKEGGKFPKFQPSVLRRKKKRWKHALDGVQVSAKSRA